MPSTLEDRWQQDVAKFMVNKKVKSDILTEVIARHSEPHRRYHGVGHLKSLFQILDQCAKAVTDRRLLNFAVWWHDSIYDPFATNNETLSAQLAETHLRLLGADVETIMSVRELILATANHWRPGSYEEGDYFLDADIAILGAEPTAYKWYSEAVRGEYAIVPDDAYRAGRTVFLQNALAQSQLFRTHAFGSLYNEQARANMMCELTELK